MPCGGPKKSPRTLPIVQIIFSFWPFEISEGILRNQKFSSSLIAFSILGFVWIILVFVSSILLKVAKLQNFLWLHLAKSKGSLNWLK